MITLPPASDKTGQQSPGSAVTSVSPERRVLILAPTGNDARLTEHFLTQAGLAAQTCRDAKELSDEAERGCGAILLAEETLDHNSIWALVQVLKEQPPWSDIPVTIITSGGEVNQSRLRRLAIFGPGGNVTLLERPFRHGTLISTVKAALRGRQRQYEMNRLLEEVREREERYRQLVHGLPNAVYTTDDQGSVKLFNEAAVALWGRRPDVGKDMWCGSHRVFRPDGTPLPLDQCPLAVSLREGRSVRGEEIIIERPDGLRRNILPYTDPIRDASGKIVGAVNLLLDVTENKRAEEASRRLAALVESSDDAIISKDLNGIITSWNQGAERIFGYRAEEVIGRSIIILMPPDRQNEEPAILGRIRRGEGLTHFETIRQRKDGTLIEVSLTVSPIRDANNKVIGASKIGRDITKQKHANRELERAHKVIIASSRAKDEFLAALSHELRTPLNPVLLIASEAAANPDLPPQVQADFATIVKNVSLEARLIDDLLDLTRISRGKLALNLSTLDVHAVLGDAIATVQGELDHKKLSLNTRLTAEPHMVQGDAVRLQQIFWNVLKNAVKFTPERGNITVETRVLAGAEALAVICSDTGMGLTETEQSQVFTAFIQGEHAGAGGAHQFGGLGLGLAITRSLVESHGGSITVASEGRNRGATFSITLPLPALPSSPPATSHPPGARVKPLAGLSILLVEDHEPTRTALSRLLVRRHHQVAPAATISEARALAGKDKFDLVICDIGLPDGNGYDLMAGLRAEHQLKGIALTGYGTESDIARSQTAGFVLHLTKPIRADELETAIATARNGAPVLTPE